MRPKQLDAKTANAAYDIFFRLNGTNLYDDCYGHDCPFSSSTYFQW